MAAKIAFLILVIALTGASLLSVRQQRLQIVHEMTEHLERAERTQRAVWRVRAELARRITPAEIRAAIEDETMSTPGLPRYRPPGTVLRAGWDFAADADKAERTQ
jgi:type II secretory pathway component PulJ